MTEESEKINVKIDNNDQKPDDDEKGNAHLDEDEDEGPYTVHKRKLTVSWPSIRFLCCD